MILKTGPQYPVRRAYVVKLSYDATPQALRGRLENLVSGKHQEFLSAGELGELIATDIDAGGADAPVEP